MLKPLLVPANLELGDVTEIYCIIKKGSPPVIFKWLHNGKEIISHSKYKINTAETSSRFYMGKIEASDIGNFTCIASNPFGMDSKSEMVSMEGGFIVYKRFKNRFKVCVFYFLNYFYLYFN